ncbi:MAG TPA: CRTAC1 family protein, partial [Verrucomicrobia bacterium]|nr:CRTAC1 family protein [Verrucomicrobiota bacterium]
QVSPVFGIAIGDLDGDGAEDAFLAQNFFGVSPSESRQDAGSGLWLRGNGKGEFESITVSESGITVDGEGRGAALCDFDQDGRLDLAVGQNGAVTKLFRNQAGKPGLRVRLQGPPENPTAAGASARIHFQNGQSGPRHEIQIGSGYWSQAGSDIILGISEAPKNLEILWPNGKKESISLRNSTLKLIRRTMPR